MPEWIMWPIGFWRWWFDSTPPAVAPLVVMILSAITGAFVATYRVHAQLENWLEWGMAVTLGGMLMAGLIPPLAFLVWFGSPVLGAYAGFWVWCKKRFREKLAPTDPDIIAAKNEVERILS